LAGTKGMGGEVFDVATLETVRKAFAARRGDAFYIMVPADDGGQTYEMKCTVCGEFGNILASRFGHADGCPVEMEERNMRR
jgi:hypothetical protein